MAIRPPTSPTYRPTPDDSLPVAGTSCHPASRAVPFPVPCFPHRAAGSARWVRVGTVPSVLVPGPRGGRHGGPFGPPEHWLSHRRCQQRCSTMTACEAAGSVDKAGSDVVVLRLATSTRSTPAGRPTVRRRSSTRCPSCPAGGLRVGDRQGYGAGAASAESELVEAIAAGDVDGGWPSTRAFARAGIGGLESVEAPMTLTSYAAERALVTSPSPHDRWAPSTAPECWDSVSRSVPCAGRSPRTRRFSVCRTGKASGSAVSTPPCSPMPSRRSGPSRSTLGFGWMDQVAPGPAGRRVRHRPKRQQRPRHRGGPRHHQRRAVAEGVRPQCQSGAIRHLTEQEQGVGRRSCRRGALASVEGDFDEDNGAGGPRAAGGHTSSRPAMRNWTTCATRLFASRLWTGSAPTPRGGPSAAAIQAIAAAHPEPDVPEVHGTCRTDDGGVGPVPRTTSSLPDGLYRVELSADDVIDADLGHSGGWSGTWTLTVSDGTFQLGCRCAIPVSTAARRRSTRPWRRATSGGRTRACGSSTIASCSTG